MSEQIHQPLAAPQTFQAMNIPSNALLNYDQSVVGAVYIRKVVIRESGTYNDQFTRAYEAHLSAQSVNALANKAAESGMGVFRPSTLSGLASNMISISAAPESNVPINIDNGWGNRRLLFFMDVLTEDLSGAQTVYFIQGYTNYVGLSLQSRSIDPNMVFYINNIVVSRLMQPVNTPQGVMHKHSLVNTDHVLYDMQADPNNRQWTMRPQDIFHVLTSHNFGMSAQGSTNNRPPNVLDNRNRLHSVPQMSRRTNAIASNYASNLVGGFLQAAESVNPVAAPTETYDAAGNVVGETTINLNPFMLALSKRRSSGFIGGTFYWRDLLALDQNVERVLTVATAGPTQIRQQHSAGMTSDWSGANVETKYAATISQAIPALMLECMLYQVAFTSNNMMRVEGNFNGIYTLMSNGTSMHGGSAVGDMETFKTRLEIEVLKDISYNNQQKFDIRVQSSVFGDTWVSISIDGGPYVDFVTPTFCDGVITPVLTHSYGKIENMASSIDNLVSQVGDALHQSSQSRHVFSLPNTGTSTLL